MGPLFRDYHVLMYILWPFSLCHVHYNVQFLQNEIIAYILYYILSF